MRTTLFLHFVFHEPLSDVIGHTGLFVLVGAGFEANVIHQIWAVEARAERDRVWDIENLLHICGHARGGGGGARQNWNVGELALQNAERCIIGPEVVSKLQTKSVMSDGQRRAAQSDRKNTWEQQWLSSIVILARRFRSYALASLAMNILLFIIFSGVQYSSLRVESGSSIAACVSLASARGVVAAIVRASIPTELRYSN